MYLDDGESLEEKGTSEMQFEFRNGSLSVTGTFNYDTSATLKAFTVLGLETGHDGVGGSGNGTRVKIEVDEPLHRTGGFEVNTHGR